MGDDKGFTERSDLGWWEYGVGGYVLGETGEPVEPHWSQSRLAAEIETERFDGLYVVRRWVTAGVWERVESDGHPGVDDWTWARFLEWRDAQAIKAREGA